MSDHGQGGDNLASQLVDTTAISWSPDGQYLAIGTYDFLDTGDYNNVAVSLVSINDSSRYVLYSDDEASPVEQIVWAPSGQELYFVDSAHSRVIRYSVSPAAMTGEMAITSNPDMPFQAVTSLSISEDNNYLLIGSTGGWEVFNTVTLDSVRWQSVNTGVRWVGWRPNHDQFLTVYENGALVLWSSSEFTEIKTISPRYNTGLAPRGIFDNHITVAAWSPTGEYLAVGDSEGVVRIWHIDEAQHTAFYREYGEVIDLAWNPVYPVILVTGSSSIETRNTLTRERLNKWSDAAMSPHAVWSPDGVRIAIGRQDTPRDNLLQILDIGRIELPPHE